LSKVAMSDPFYGRDQLLKNFLSWFLN